MARTLEKEEKPFGLKWRESPIRALGTHVSYDIQKNDNYNFKEKLQKIGTVHDIWQSRNFEDVS